jgi:hypothetical protein
MGRQVHGKTTLIQNNILGAHGCAIPRLIQSEAISA